MNRSKTKGNGVINDQRNRSYWYRSVTCSPRTNHIVPNIHSWINDPRYHSPRINLAIYSVVVDKHTIASPLTSTVYNIGREMVLLRPQEITATTGRWLLIRRWLLLLSLLTIVIVLHVQSRRRADAITSAQNASNSSAQQKEADEEAEDSRDRLKRDIVVNPGPKAPIAPSNTKLTDVEYAPGQQLVKRMMRTAWRAYYQYARDFDELAPLSKTGTNFYGRDTLKLTAIDSLDTLLIMGLQEEFQQAKQLVLDVSFDRDMNISVFESNIRIVGGLLSVFALTGDGQYVSKAFDLANRYRSVFSPLDVSAPNWTFPLREVDLVGHFKVMDAPTRPQQDVVILAEVGTLTLELAYLAHITKDRTLVKKAEDAIQRLSEMTSPYPGLLPRLIQTKATHQTGYFGVGGMADSYYEYLLKYYVQTGNLMHKRLLEQALDVSSTHVCILIDDDYRASKNTWSRRPTANCSSLGGTMSERT
jgi:hypothetical protein